MRFLLPIILLVAAIGLFAVFTNPTYQEVKTLQSQAGAFDEALDKAKELKSSRDELISKRNTFTTDNVQKLDHILPDNVDNIRFVIDINSIAARHNLSLKNVSVGTISDSKVARGALAVGASGDAVGSAEISFSLVSSYDDYLAFLQDLEHSLRIVDIESINFTTNTEGNTEYTMTIRTYWLH